MNFNTVINLFIGKEGINYAIKSRWRIRRLYQSGC